MSLIWNLARDLGRHIRLKLDWTDRHTPCPINVVSIIPILDPDNKPVRYNIKQHNVTDSTGLPISDPAPTYTGIDDDEVLLTTDRNAIAAADELESQRCYIGYDTEYEEFIDDDDEPSAFMVSHQLYFAQNGRRKGIVIQTDVRFSESAFVELISQATEDTVKTAYLVAHFSLAEGAWLTQSIVNRNRALHAEFFHNDPGGAAAVMVESAYINTIIESVFKEAGKLPKTNNKATKAHYASLPPCDWVPVKTKRRLLKWIKPVKGTPPKEPRDAFNEFCQGKIDGISVSPLAQKFMKELREFRPVINKRDKTWHGTYPLRTASALDDFTAAGSEKVKLHINKVQKQHNRPYDELIAESVILRNTDYTVEADGLWWSLADREADGRRQRRSKRQKDAVPKLPKRSIIFCDSKDFGVGSLKDVGETISIPKLDSLLADDEIDNMSAVKSADPERFCRYGFRDAVVSAEAVAWFGRLFRLELGLPLSTRVAAYSAKHFQTIFRDKVYAEKRAAALEAGNRKEVNLKHYLGWDVRKNRNGTKSWFPTAEMESFARFYAGGWNAVHQTGSLGPCTYWDLKSAYPCAVLMLNNDYDFSEQRAYYADQAQAVVDEMMESGPFQIAGLTVSFKFNDDAEPMFPLKIDKSKLPPLSPVEAQNILIYAQTGESHVMWPEFYTAVKLGLLDWYVVQELVTYQTMPTTHFADEVNHLLRLRGQRGKKPIYKNLLNYLYGKTAQSIGKAQVKTAHGMGERRRKPGALTCFPIAAYSTSVCRAVMGELLNGNECYAITTDGFVSPVMDHSELVIGEISEATQKVLSTMTDYKGNQYQYIEPAYIAEQSLFIKTRGYVLDGTDEDGKQYVKTARMGVQTHRSAPEDDEDDMRVPEFLEALEVGSYMKKSFPGFAKLKVDGQDLLPLMQTRKTRVSHSFDMKRVPVGPVTETTFSYGGVDYTHPTFKTVPLTVINDFLLLRNLAEPMMTTEQYVELIARYRRGRTW